MGLHQYWLPTFDTMQVTYLPNNADTPNLLNTTGTYLLDTF